MQQPSTAAIHFYRAAVGHADIWRQRLDSTTNWAIVTNAGMITFAFNSPASLHFLLLLLLLIDLFFLHMETRRYQDYDLWRERLRLMERYVFAPAFSIEAEAQEGEEAIRPRMDDLARHLGYSVPRVGLLDAMGYRIRRNYGYIFAITLAAWALKVWMHPLPATTVREWVQRTDVGFLGGPVVVLTVLVLAVTIAYLGLRAPPERMIEWTEQPSPLAQLREMPWFDGPPLPNPQGPPALGR